MFPAYLLLSSFSLAYDPETVCDGAGDLPTGDVFEVSADVVFVPTLHDGDMFGDSMAVGDFNGDGLDDIAIGAPLADFSSVLTNTGAVHIWLGKVGFAPSCSTQNCIPAGGGY